jgi:hypothetical protein
MNISELVKFLKMKEQLISQLFDKKWNYAWGNADNHLIGLYYSLGGFEGLLELLVSKKEKMKDYSSDLISTLEQLILNDVTDEDFEQYITKNIDYHYTNFNKLKEFGMLNLYKEFDSNFRGNIVQFHKISHYGFIETFKTKPLYYPVNEKLGDCFETLDKVLLHVLFKGQYQNSLDVLYQSVNN